VTFVRTLLIYKWARNVEDALVRDDGSLDWRNAKMSAGEDDPVALAAAVGIAEASGGEVIGLTIGDGDTSWALARGVSQAFTVSDVTPLTDNAATAAVLAAAVRRLPAVDVILIGDSKQESGAAVALGGLLGWPAMVGLITAFIGDAQLLAVRRVGGQMVQYKVPTPVVLGIAAEGEDAKVPGMKELLAARRRPVTTLSLADLGVDVGDPAVAGRSKAAVTTARLFDGTPDEAAAKLLAALRTEGVL